MGTAVVAAAIVAPWLVWLPAVSGPAPVLVLGAIAIVAAFHGWGRLVARIARVEVGAPVAIQWGIAACVALGGAMIAFHVYDARLLVIAGATAHSADLALRFAEARDAVDARRHGGGITFWLIPAALIAVLAFVHVLGSAGQVATRPFDDDGNVLAQLERLARTGTLGDAIGFPRTAQLGGHEAISALVTPFGEAGAGRMVDAGLGLALFLVLACARIRPRDAISATWATLAIIAVSSYRLPWHDPAPLWIPAGLILTLLVTIETATGTARSAIPIALVAGALAATRSELAPVAATFVVCAWLRGRRPWREDLPRIAVLASTLVVVLPYAITRSLAWSAVDPVAHALLASRHVGVVGALVLCVLIAAATLPLLLLAVRDLEGTSARWLAWAGAIGLAATTSQLAGQRPYALRFLWPLALAGIVVLASAVARRERMSKLAVVLATLACLVVRDDATAFGRSAWSRRYYDLLFDVDYARNAAHEGGGYDRAFAAIPAGETVAVWVERPELLDATRHHIVDLRTPRIAPMRDASDNRFDRLVAASRARWLVVEADDAFRKRSDASWLYHLACPRLVERCADRLEAMVLRGPRVASADGVDVIALPSP